jgi:hypothetical protein
MSGAVAIVIGIVSRHEKRNDRQVTFNGAVDIKFREIGAPVNDEGA